MKIFFSLRFLSLAKELHDRYLILVLTSHKKCFILHTHSSLTSSKGQKIYLLKKIKGEENLVGQLVY
jgi:hypothetical protein